MYIKSCLKTQRFQINSCSTAEKRMTLFNSFGKKERQWSLLKNEDRASVNLCVPVHLSDLVIWVEQREREMDKTEQDPVSLWDIIGSKIKVRVKEKHVLGLFMPDKKVYWKWKVKLVYLWPPLQLSPSAWLYHAFMRSHSLSRFLLLLLFVLFVGAIRIKKNKFKGKIFPKLLKEIILRSIPTRRNCGECFPPTNSHPIILYWDT